MDGWLNPIKLEGHNLSPATGLLKSPQDDKEEKSPMSKVWYEKWHIASECNKKNEVEKLSPI